jgi:uncharacterized protein YdaU (DUF1376 family)
MHYYQFNIGDYASHTRHLSLMENLAYRLLLDLYYLHERPLNACLTTVARQINMRDHKAEVEAVLSEFFSLTDAGWVNKRADIEIEKYHGKIEQASKAGKASAAKRMSNACSTGVQPNIKQETRNKKQEPLNNNQVKTLTPSVSREKIAFDGSRFSGLESYLDTWIETYPAINVHAEILKAASWLMANPKNSKSQYARFLNNWLARAQDKAPSARGSPDRPKNNSEKFNEAFRNVFGDNNEPTERDITALATRVD